MYSSSATLPNLFIAAGMRTGSTHIRNCFLRLGLKPANIHYGIENAYNEEHMVDIDAAQILLPMGGWCFQQHMRAIGRNAPLLKMHGVRPVVTYRNILDCLVSWVEQESVNLDRGRGIHYIFAPIHGASEWRSMSEYQKYDWAILNVLPWYTGFYVSWAEADIETLFVKYEEYYADQIAGMRRIMAWLGGDYRNPSDDELRAIAQHQDGRLTVGKIGRGREKIPEDQIKLVERHMDSWGPNWGRKLRDKLLV